MPQSLRAAFWDHVTSFGVRRRVEMQRLRSFAVVMGIAALAVTRPLVEAASPCTFGV